MRQLLAGLLFVFSFAISASAQTVIHSNNFTFATGTIISQYSVPQQCGTITEWDGVPDAYPEEMGGVCVTSVFASIDVPFQLGYLNNGYLSPCDQIVNWTPKVFSKGDGTHTGDMFSISGSTTCPYFTGEYGTYENSNNRLEGFSVVANYTVLKYTSCYRRCATFYKYFLTGGTGMVTDSLVN